jgi:hypothetical protein
LSVGSIFLPLRDHDCLLLSYHSIARYFFSLSTGLRL